ncbi:hypothetical protein KIL84_002248 [Mauremys mutica]|uniref:Uncharacterized protein n=1 Tax=Mauremys mutica TaxID=74926 RepID=A0A9D4AY04_9SAUR|nr:hypothetical protein KIL84_002248 [Mauremys mutica]
MGKKQGDSGTTQGNPRSVQQPLGHPVRDEATLGWTCPVQGAWGLAPFQAPGGAIPPNESSRCPSHRAPGDSVRGNEAAVASWEGTANRQGAQGHLDGCGQNWRDQFEKCPPMTLPFLLPRMAAVSCPMG